MRLVEARTELRENVRVKESHFGLHTSASNREENKKAEKKKNKTRSPIFFSHCKIEDLSEGPPHDPTQKQTTRVPLRYLKVIGTPLKVTFVGCVGFITGKKKNRHLQWNRYKRGLFS
jgi:hypothetical protein